MNSRRLMVLCAVLLIVFAAVQVWLPLAPPGRVEIFIPKGRSTQAIARRLKEAGVIRSAFLFSVWAELSGEAAHLQSGHYRFEAAASLPQVLDRMVRGDAILYRTTVPEGLRTDEVLARMARATKTPLAVWRQALKELVGSKMEGILLPETYTYHKPVDPRRMLERMIAAQRQVIHPLLPTWIDPEGLRIVASIVEKETALDKERPLVAAVIRNRLVRHMPLQMDSTVIYGLWRTDGFFSGNLHKADMQRDTPWNTYTRRGLPPTPICNPGEASLIAAAHPANVDFLYFVADGSGGHVFSDSLKAHEKNVRRWIRVERRAVDPQPR